MADLDAIVCKFNQDYIFMFTNSVLSLQSRDADFSDNLYHVYFHSLSYNKVHLKFVTCYRRKMSNCLWTAVATYLDWH